MRSLVALAALVLLTGCPAVDQALTAVPLPSAPSTVANGGASIVASGAGNVISPNGAQIISTNAGGLAPEIKPGNGLVQPNAGASTAPTSSPEPSASPSTNPAASR